MTEFDVEKLIQALGLQPLAGEGGLYYESYRSPEEIPLAALPERYKRLAGSKQGNSSSEAENGAPRPLGTAIFYLLTAYPAGRAKGDPSTGNASFSALHRLLTDEIYHFYLGDPLEMTLLYPDGTSRHVTLGQDIFKGQQLQFVVPHGVWQGSRLADGGRFALVGTTMAPGFTPADYEHGDRAALLEKYPQEREHILALTR